MNVTVVGCGARGALVATLLASAGVEQLSLVDGAFVEDSDAGAHPLQFSPDVGTNKADALVAKIALLNGDTLVLPFPADLTAENAEAIVTGADVVVECTSSPEAAAAVATACEALNINFVATPDAYDATTVNIAEAAAIAATQAATTLNQA